MFLPDGLLPTNTECESSSYTTPQHGLFKATDSIGQKPSLRSPSCQSCWCRFYGRLAAKVSDVFLNRFVSMSMIICFFFWYITTISLRGHQSNPSKLDAGFVVWDDDLLPCSRGSKYKQNTFSVAKEKSLMENDSLNSYMIIICYTTVTIVKFRQAGYFSST